jgi:hypothetical protein
MVGPEQAEGLNEEVKETKHTNATTKSEVRNTKQTRPPQKQRE